MGKKDKINFSDIGLRLALDLWGMDDLHFGWWDGLEVIHKNIPAAQKQYIEKIAAHIPEGVQTILDVGCGIGNVALYLREKGYQLECLAPDPKLIEKARERLGDRTQVHISRFEDFETDHRYDLVLMSESCQYIKSGPGLAQAAKFLKPGGTLLAADVFRHLPWPREKPYISKAGHNIDRFLNSAKENGFTVEERVDITDHVGPTLDLYDDFLQGKVIPIAEAVVEALGRGYPFTTRILGWIWGAKLKFVRKKYRHQDLKTFREYRKYLLLRFRKNES